MLVIQSAFITLIFFSIITSNHIIFNFILIRLLAATKKPFYFNHYNAYSINFNFQMQKESQQKTTAIKVFIRVRPLVGQQLGTDQVVQVAEDLKTINITTDAVTSLTIKFDQALPKTSTQRQCFSHFQQSVQRIPSGYNMTVFAYGQTGSGKTHTMFGSDWEYTVSRSAKGKQQQNTFFQDLQTDQNHAGLIPRTIYRLFSQIQKFNDNKTTKPTFNVYCSFLQIYNQKIYDLLQDFPKPKPLNIHESKFDGVFVEGLAQYAVTHYTDCIELMKRGEKNRFIRQTSMNTKSSRSHTIFQILLESLQADSKGMFKKARLNLCDLAGSEKINKMEHMNGDHLQQLKNINQSLTTLGKVIASLSSKHKSIASFRQSKLTRLLQQSLTGNTFTFIIGNISPSSKNMDETMNTLKFVQRARHIVMKVKAMEFNGQNMEIVHKLQKEVCQINYLKQLLNLKRKGLTADDIQSKLVNLQEENEKLRKTTVSFHDVEKLIEENHRMRDEIHKLHMMNHTQTDNDFDSKSQASFYSQLKSQGLTVTDKLQQKLKKNGFQLNTSTPNRTRQHLHPQSQILSKLPSNSEHIPIHQPHFPVIHHDNRQRSKSPQPLDKDQQHPMVKDRERSHTPEVVHMQKNGDKFPVIELKDRYKSKSGFYANTQPKEQREQRGSNINESVNLPFIQHTDRMRSKSHDNDSSHTYTPNVTKKSINPTKRLIQSQNQIPYKPLQQKPDKKKQKQKILDKLQQLQRIQKFNEEKLMRDLDNLDRKGAQVQTKASSQVKKKSLIKEIAVERKDTKVNVAQRKNVNYEHKIKLLQAKLFGK